MELYFIIFFKISDQILGPAYLLAWGNTTVLPSLFIDFLIHETLFCYLIPNIPIHIFNIQHWPFFIFLEISFF